MTPAPTGIEALLDELEALRERATPGEWKRLPGSSLIECDGRPIAECEHIVPGGDLRADFDKCHANADYIAAIINAAPSMFATLRSQSRALAEREETIGRLREALTEMVKMHHRTDDGTGRWDWALGEAESALASAPKGEP